MSGNRGAIVALALGVAVCASSPAGAEPFPNVALQTHAGARVRFYDDLIKDKVVLINFFFTTCTSICPRTTENLRKVEEGLGDRLGREVRIISITVDPDTDTPGVLDEYARRHGTKPGWVFVTGRREDIDAVRRHLGVNRDGADKTQHTGVLVYGNEATGQWAATAAMGNPRTIVRNVLRLLEP